MSPLSLMLTYAATALAAAVSCENPNGQNMGTIIHNQLDTELHVSLDWPPYQCDDHSELDADTYSILPANSGPHCFFGFPQTSPKIYLGLTCNARTAAVGSKRDHDTVVEVSYGLPGHELGNYGAYLTYYDVDLENGFSVPVWCTGPNPRDPRDAQVGCKTDILGHCPEDMQFMEDGRLTQCRNPQTPQVIDQWRQFCPGSYIKSDDDWSSHGLGSLNHVVECWVGGPYPYSN